MRLRLRLDVRWAVDVPLTSACCKSIVDVLPPIACHRGTVAVSFGFRRMLNSMVNARDRRFILVQASIVDRVTTLRPVSVCLLRWIDYEVLCCTIVVLSFRSPALLYIIRRPES